MDRRETERKKEDREKRKEKKKIERNDHLICDNVKRCLEETFLFHLSFLKSHSISVNIFWSHDIQCYDTQENNKTQHKITFFEMPFIVLRVVLADWS